MADNGYQKVIEKVLNGQGGYRPNIDFGVTAKQPQQTAQSANVVTAKQPTIQSAYDTGEIDAEIARTKNTPVTVAQPVAPETEEEKRKRDRRAASSKAIAGIGDALAAIAQLGGAAGEGVPWTQYDNLSKAASDRWAKVAEQRQNAWENYYERVKAAAKEQSAKEAARDEKLGNLYKLKLEAQKAGDKAKAAALDADIKKAKEGRDAAAAAEELELTKAKTAQTKGATENDRKRANAYATNQYAQANKAAKGGSGNEQYDYLPTSGSSYVKLPKNYINEGTMGAIYTQLPQEYQDKNPLVNIGMEDTRLETMLKAIGEYVGDLNDMQLENDAVVQSIRRVGGEITRNGGGALDIDEDEETIEL